MAADLPDDAWGVCADSLLPHELCSLARASQGLNRAITSSRAYRLLAPRTLGQQKGAVLCVSVAPGGGIVSGSADGWLKEWTVAGTQATCQDIVQQRGRKIVCAAALPDSRIVSGSPDGEIRLTDKAVPPGRKFLETHWRGMYGVAVRQDGSVVTIGQDMNGHGQLKVWDVATGRCSRSIFVREVPISLAILSDGRVLMGSACMYIYVYDFSSTETFVSCLQGSSPGGRNAHTTGGVNAVAGLPNKRVVSASDDKTLKVWNLADREVAWLTVGANCKFTLRGHRGRVLCVAALPRNRIVSGSRDKTLKVWDITHGHGMCLQTLRGHTGWVNCVGLLPDGRVVSGSRDKTLKVWGFIKCFADLCANAILSPEPETGGVMVAFRCAGGFSRRRRFVETDDVAALFKYCQAEAKLFLPGGLKNLLCEGERQLGPLVGTPLKDADVDGREVILTSVQGLVLTPIA